MMAFTSQVLLVQSLERRLVLTTQYHHFHHYHLVKKKEEEEEVFHYKTHRKQTKRDSFCLSLTLNLRSGPGYILQ